MNRVSKVVGIRRSDKAEEHSTVSDGDELLLDDFLDEPAFAEQDRLSDLQPLDSSPEFQADPAVAPLIVQLARGALVLAALGWIGLAVALVVQRGMILPPIEMLPSAIATFSTPLILIGIAYMLLMRGSLGEATRFSRITAKLGRESDALDMRLAIVNQQLDTARQTLQDQARLLENYGASASINLETAANLLGEHASSSAQHADVIAQSGASLRHQFSELVDAMPLLEEKAAWVSNTLADGSHALADKVERLEMKLETLVKLTEDARSRSLAATQSLTAQLLQVQDATRSASEELTGMADLSAQRIGNAVDRVRQVMDETGLSLDVRLADLNVLVDQSRNALDSIGGRAVATFAETIDAVETRLHELNRMVEGQSQLIAGIDTDLVGKIDRLDHRFATFEADGIARNERLGEALGAIGVQTERLDHALQAGNQTAEGLIGRSEALLLALDASVRELDESHPAALDRLNERIEHSRSLLAAAAPEIEGLEAVANALFGRTREAEELLRGQSRRLTEWLENSQGALTANEEQVRALEAALLSADEGARRLTDSSGPQLVAALLRIKDTADQAAERARQALGRAISDAASSLGEVSEAALQQVLGERITVRIDEVSAVAERAVKAAHTASDRLMRQLLTISDTSESIEARVREAEEHAEARDRDHFARRSAILIESLNGAAIDIAKALSGEVSDSSWAAYLKGDRGVFTRRAVRLLDNGDSRSIAQLYDGDDAFREQVNHYIRDFEGMLRNILAARDGSALGVTILSSDMGKLYVALAQAIDRLRT